MKHIPFFKPLIDENEEQAVLRILRSGWLTTGKETLEFEKEFADFVGSRYAFAVNSATSGLLLALDACGVGTGSAVITSPYTFASTATSAVHLGADVLYADVNHDDYNISIESVENLLRKNKNVKAIIPIHIAGNVCKMQALNNLAKQYGVKVIEDAAHAFPAKTKTGFAGTLGDAGVFSFYATKTITTAEGGMICTDNAELAERIKIMRMHGIEKLRGNTMLSKQVGSATCPIFFQQLVACNYKKLTRCLRCVNLLPNTTMNVFHKMSV